MVNNFFFFREYLFFILVMRCYVQNLLIVIRTTLVIGLTGPLPIFNIKACLYWNLFLYAFCIALSSLSAEFHDSTIMELYRHLCPCYLIRKRLHYQFWRITFYLKCDVVSYCCRLDFSYNSNNWGVGLPPKEKNEKNWPL